MNIASWPSLKSSPVMQEIRLALKKKTEPGQPTPSRKEANKVWREDILGILSEEQKKEQKIQKQNKNKKVKFKTREEEE